MTKNSGESWTKSTVHLFTGGNDGGNPSHITIDAKGNIFGTATTNGNLPLAPLIMDASGNLYGVNASGGTNAWGTAFRLSPLSGGAWSTSVLFPFKNARDGGTPEGALVMDSNGNLYGTGTTGGGPTSSGVNNTGNGVVFRLTPPGVSGGIKSALPTASGGGETLHP